MLVAVVAVMILVLAALELAALPARLVPFASEARAVTGPVAWRARRPRIRRIFAIAEYPFRCSAASDPAMQAGM